MRLAERSAVAPASLPVGERLVAAPPGVSVEDPDRTLGDNAALLGVGVTDRRLLDHKPCRRDTDFQRGVVEVARWSPRGPRRGRLEYAAVEWNGMATGAEGQPVQVDRGALNTCRRADACACAGNRHTATIPPPADRDNNVDRPLRERSRWTGKPGAWPRMGVRELA